MKRVLLGMLVSTMFGMAANAADVGVSISIGQPGFYGQLDIGSFPRPSLIYAQPVIISRPPGVVLAPVYLHVPPGHAKNWKRYCGRYDACGRPVYFVQDRWYNEVYVPEYRRVNYNGRDDRGRNDHDDHDGDHDRGNGRGNGKGKGRDR
ncbi:MAG: hypothetical protein QM808_06565 [Steroidobacteraceae bacterium]